MVCPSGRTIDIPNSISSVEMPTVIASSFAFTTSARARHRCRTACSYAAAAAVGTFARPVVVRVNSGEFRSGSVSVNRTYRSLTTNAMAACVLLVM